MPIVTVENKILSPRIRGKIRLGIKKESSTGMEIPANVDYFVLSSVPELKEVYGEAPKELHVRFFTSDREVIAPYYYRWYSGQYKDKKTGEVIHGDCICKGDGAKAEYFAGMKGGVIPIRECKVEQCPDWYNKNGVQQCHMVMNLRVVLPFFDDISVYQIDTPSSINISEIQRYLKYETLDPNFYKKVYLLKRYQKKIKYVDKKTGEQRETVQWLLGIAEIPYFYTTYAAQLEERDKRIQLAYKDCRIPTSFESIEYDGAEPLAQLESPQAVMVDLTSIAEDSDLAPLFVQLSKLKKQENSPEKRYSMVRWFKDNRPDVVDIKEGVKELILKRISELAPTLPDAGSQPGQSS